MYGTLAGALSGRKIPFERQRYTATVDGRIVGIGKTIRIESITIDYDLTIPAESRAIEVQGTLSKGAIQVAPCAKAFQSMFVVAEM
jgi:hypothetical protein